MSGVFELIEVKKIGENVYLTENTRNLTDIIKPSMIQYNQEDEWGINPNPLTEIKNSLDRDAAGEIIARMIDVGVQYDNQWVAVGVNEISNWMRQYLKKFNDLLEKKVSGQEVEPPLESPLTIAYCAAATVGINRILEPKTDPEMGIKRIVQIVSTMESAGYINIVRAGKWAILEPTEKLVRTLYNAQQSA